jgi:hypothetical protein
MKKTFESFVVMTMLVLGCVCTTGCGVDDVAKTANSAKETVVNTASDAKENVDWWTRSTDHQSWTNKSGTKIEINERRKEGDFEIKITYSTDDLDSWGEEKYTESPVTVMYVDKLTEELVTTLREQ